MSKAQLLEDIFEVLEKDPDGKKFDKGAVRGLVNCYMMPRQRTTRSSCCRRPAGPDVAAAASQAFCLACTLPC